MSYKFGTERFQTKLIESAKNKSKNPKKNKYVYIYKHLKLLIQNLRRYQNVYAINKRTGNCPLKRSNQ